VWDPLADTCCWVPRGGTFLSSTSTRPIDDVGDVTAALPSVAAVLTAGASVGGPA